MLLKKSAKKVIQEKLNIDNIKIESENSVTLLGITIGYQLLTKFQNYVTKHPCS